MTMAPELIDRRISVLNDFLAKLKALCADDRKRSAQHRPPTLRAPVRTSERAAEARDALNRMCVPVKQAVADAGISTHVVAQAPAIVGGMVRSVPIFENLFNRNAFYGVDLSVHAVDAINKALGVYEALREGNGLVRLEVSDGIDIVSAINRSLRPAFSDPPASEKSVQEAVATILRAIGTRFNREQDRAAIGTTTFIPDFTVPESDLAIEVKLTNAKHSEADAQRELTEDVAAFRTRWKRLLAVIYDVSAIRDPERIKREFENHFGVQVVIIKH